MDTIYVQGGVALQGRVRIQGSKNAALPILAASLLTRESCYICNCPKISDVHKMLCLLSALGCKVRWEAGGVRINAKNVCRGEMPVEAVRGMRSSLCLLGALLGRCGEVVMEYPGGCVIGERPIDLHLWALGKMGVCFQEKAGRLRAYTTGLHGARLKLSFPSVGATENILLAAVLAEGDTILDGAAREPEVSALCRFLVCCGAKISGIGTSRLYIQGKRLLNGAEFTIPADRIVAGTYLFGCIGAGGEIFMEKAPWREMRQVLCIAEKLGARCMTAEDGLYVQASGIISPIDCIRTDIYPGFPTDLQSAVLTVLTKAEGESRIEEHIFENRFRIVKSLCDMGAKIQKEDCHCVSIQGVERLTGAAVEAGELRGGAALVLAGMMADGETRVGGCSYIYRGHENICRDLRELGARIVSV